MVEFILFLFFYIKFKKRIRKKRVYPYWNNIETKTKCERTFAVRKYSYFQLVKIATKQQPSSTGEGPLRLPPSTLKASHPPWRISPPPLSWWCLKKKRAGRALTMSSLSFVNTALSGAWRQGAHHHPTPGLTPPPATQIL